MRNPSAKPQPPRGSPAIALRDWQIWAARRGGGVTYRQLAEDYGVSLERIRQIVARRRRAVSFCLRTIERPDWRDERDYFGERRFWWVDPGPRPPAGTPFGPE